MIQSMKSTVIGNQHEASSHVSPVEEITEYCTDAERPQDPVTVGIDSIESTVIGNQHEASNQVSPVEEIIVLYR